MTFRQPPNPIAGMKGETTSLGRTVGMGTLVIALVVGIQLGSIPWRYRRQIWQLQGFLLGALAGYVLGRLNAANPGESPSPTKNPPRLPGG
jgi:sulfite exporter TauE/SafE